MFRFEMSELSKAQFAQFAAQLHEMEQDMQTELEQEFEDVASDIAQRGRERGRSLGGVHAHSSEAIGTRGSTIEWDTRSHPEVLGAEFGGGKYGKGNPKPGSNNRGYTTQFPPHKGREGYMVYAVIRDHTEEYMERYGDAVDRASAVAFNDRRESPSNGN